MAAEAQLPIAPQFLGQAGLYRGYSAYGAVPALPYASAYSAPVNFAYGAQITALNASPAPVVAAPVESLATYGFGDNNGYGAPSAPVIASYAQAVPAPVIAEAVPAPVIAKAAPIAASHSSQYQAQDEDKNFSFGYSNINSAKQETGNAYGGVTGSYTYTDEAGVHTVNYVADHLGFRVNSDNLPVAPANLAVAPVHIAEPVLDTPAVVEAKAAFFKAYNAAKSGVVKREAQSILPQTYAGLSALNYAGYQPYSAPLAYNGFPHFNYATAPLTTAYAAAPAIAAPAIAAPAIAAPTVATPFSYHGVSPLNYAAAPAISAPAIAAPAIAAPVAYAGEVAPLREATLTTIKLNPGHATFYRVD